MRVKELETSIELSAADVEEVISMVPILKLLEKTDG